MYVRLTGHNSTFAGRVEVFSHGVWGRVINSPYYWSKKEADIVCRQLGFPEAITAVGYSAFGEGSGPVLMSDVRCLASNSPIATEICLTCVTLKFTKLLFNETRQVFFTNFPDNFQEIF